MAKTIKVVPSDVFINIPFDRDYEHLYVALIAGLTSVGLNPRCVLEVPATADRLRRLQQIITSCPFSLHDLSRVEVSRNGPFRVPRFNMPFELGLAAAVANAAAGGLHQWTVLESTPHRIGQSLSDVNGYDAQIHSGTIDGVLTVVLDVFGNVPDPPLQDIDDLRWVYRRLRKFSGTLPGGVYRPHSFKRLVLAARAFVVQRVKTHLS